MAAFKAINWNRIEDPLDKQVWDRLTANFWLPEKVPVSNDLPSWQRMTPEEQEVMRLVFTTLTLLDTLQGRNGVPSLLEHAATPHEEAVLANIGFMEHVHAKSYSTIFSTLCSTEEIDGLFRWAETDPLLQATARIMLENYDANNPAKKFGVSVLLESFLFYTGFYAPLRFAADGKLTNTADIIRLILRDEGVHGFYIGNKFQQLRQHHAIDNDEIITVLKQLYDIEYQRVEQIYDRVGWSSEVKGFLRYNANKALANLGMPPLFTPEEATIPSYILAALDPGTGEAHDFFSGSGASYVIGTAEETSDQDWEW